MQFVQILKTFCGGFSAVDGIWPQCVFSCSTYSCNICNNPFPAYNVTSYLAFMFNKTPEHQLYIIGSGVFLSNVILLGLRCLLLCVDLCPVCLCCYCLYLNNSAATHCPVQRSIVGVTHTCSTNLRTKLMYKPSIAPLHSLLYQSTP